jgi:hypothetical protein
MAPKDLQAEVRERAQDATGAPAGEAAPDDLAASADAVGADAEITTVTGTSTMADIGAGEGRAAGAPTGRVGVVFSPEEVQRLEREAARAGTSVPALVRELALTRPHLRALASIGSNNLPSNPPSAPETSSGIRVRGYSGAYTPAVGRNR